MITVVGAANVDVQAFVSDRLVKGDSSPGRISTSAGGVGRNIAHNLRLLGEDVRFITALATDTNSEIVRSNLRDLGIDFSLSLVLQDARTSSYVCILDENGALFGAVNDMGILDRLSPDHLKKALCVLKKDDFVVVDTNIPEASLVAVKKAAVAAGARLVVDTVSEPKCARCLPILDATYAIKPNRAEAGRLTGVTVADASSALAAAAVFHSRGIRYVFVSLGKDGVFYSGGGHSGVVPVAGLPVVNVSGAGDAMTAALVSALARGESVRETARFAQACASLTCACEKTTSDELHIDLARALSDTLNVHTTTGEQ